MTYEQMHVYCIFPSICTACLQVFSYVCLQACLNALLKEYKTRTRTYAEHARQPLQIKISDLYQLYLLYNIPFLNELN
jgi:hypothetical protein